VKSFQRVTLVVLIPCSALLLVGLVIAGFLVQQAIQTRNAAESLASTTAGVTSYVSSEQARRSQALIPENGRAAAYDHYNQLIDTAIATLQDTARQAPDAALGFEQLVATRLLAASDGMSRTDALATAGLGSDDFRAFAGQVGAYHADLDAVAPNLTAHGRDLYTALVHSQDWSRVVATENALLAGVPLPVAHGDWRASAAEVARQLSALYAQQSAYALQLTTDSGRRALTGALSGGAAILLLALLAFAVAIRLAPRSAPPAAEEPVDVGLFVPQPRSSRQRTVPPPAAAPLQMPDMRVMQAVLDGIRKL
jgi:Nitrate and nitrite sensing